jgi:1,4-dihydroxy-2-naphthoyl-CoA hydrolase
VTDLQALQGRMSGLFPDLLGVRLVSVDETCVVAELDVRDDLCTLPGLMHGGAIMAFADTLGAVATVANLSPGQGTTTIESKTNFLSGGRAGTTVTGTCEALHRGRRTMVWQTKITSGERTIAIVTQTQMVLEPS